jgi:hypothetical protein
MNHGGSEQSHATENLRTPQVLTVIAIQVRTVLTNDEKYDHQSSVQGEILWILHRQTGLAFPTADNARRQV